ncbi:hypothetical protein CAPTEDRAFT_186694 [Capitella teleta]|uniref:Integrator complex subunit 5 C-terminal domain-containing protein n=1 Tax=Capitella teleta TaxID=283909 RepID=R7TX07_CAPTE|nr:hypothetical protein CAPTEDRAFT_186694 [Capitella teleta]|eukprot:ELT95971.1 hypothetical protein CAPTEDRAFT_186694 [Capitella teleta]
MDCGFLVTQTVSRLRCLPVCCLFYRGMRLLYTLQKADQYQEILHEVRCFIGHSACSRADLSSIELTKSGLFLLRHLPSARLAVLEFLHKVFDSAVNVYISELEWNREKQDKRAPPFPISEIESMLLTLVKALPAHWSPIISSWAIDLLGHLSSKNAKRRPVASQVSVGINEALQFWVSCPATKTLLDISSECVSSMVNSNPESSVDALLDASVKYSPHFDWVVAHIGSCFPQTIINRVLQCGLRDFHHHGQSARSESPCLPGEAKVASVVGILGHLAGQHSAEIRKAVLTLFEESLTSRDEEKQLAIPFLLHLASMSPLLLDVVASHIVINMSVETINSVAVLFKTSSVLQKQDLKTLLHLVVHLITCVEASAFPLLEFLMKFADETPQKTEVTPIAMETDEIGILPEVQCAGMKIMSALLAELQRMVHTKSSDSSMEVALLKSLQPQINALCMLLSHSSQLRCEWLSALLASLAVHLHEDVAADVLSAIVSHATEDHQLGVFLRVQQEAEMKHANVLRHSCQKIVSSLNDQSLKNLHQLSSWEKENAGVRMSLCAMLSNHVDVLSAELSASTLEHAVCALELLSNADPNAISTACVTLASALCFFFFRLLAQSEVSQKHKRCVMCVSYLTRLCCHRSTKKHILRTLILGSVSEQHRALFGGKCDSVMHSADKGNVSLLEENALQRKRVVFHAGVIGKGLRIEVTAQGIPAAEQTHNRQLLISALSAISSCDGYHDCMETENVMTASPKLSAELAKFLALLVIEMITPDVMYNGIPWPDEEFMKVTIERDLSIKHEFDVNPVLWNIMEFISEGPGAMCYCSVLLRSVLATVIRYVEGSREKSFKSCSQHLRTTSMIIDFMRKGQMIPSPIQHTVELLPHLSPYEVYLLLINLWKYVKENPPVPISRMNVEIMCPPKYLEVIRSILHSHVDSLGHLYPLFTVHKPQPQNISS